MKFRHLDPRRRARPAPSTDILIAEQEPIVVADRILSVTTPGVLEANHPTNKLGRKQIFFTDFAIIFTNEGQRLTGIRTLKFLGGVGTDLEQAADPFQRPGTLYSARIGRLGMLTVRRTPDLVGSYHSPEFRYYASKDEVVKPAYEQVNPDEAFQAAKKFDDLFFPGASSEKIVGLAQADDVLDLRAAETHIQDFIRGL